MDQLQLPIRNAGVYSVLRRFLAVAFELLRADVARGADVSFSVAEHKHVSETVPLYEFRPQVEGFVRERLDAILELPVSQEAAWTIANDPACNAYLRAGRVDTAASFELVARDELMVPMLLAMAELRPGFTLDEDSLLAHYLRFERALYAEQRRYVAATPMWGLRLMTGDLVLAPGVRLRQVDAELFRMEWPEAAQANWGDEARDGIPHVLLEFERVVEADDDESALDPLLAINQVVAAIRALAGGSVCAGPLVLERLDYRTLAPRPVLALAARRCGAIPSRIDTTIARSLPQALRRLSSDPEGAVARALERYQYAATAQGLTALRAVFDTVTDIYADERETMSAALRMAAVVGASLAERQQFTTAMRSAALVIRQAGPPDEEVVELTRLLAAGLRATIAAALVGELPLSRLQDYADSILLGERERKQLGVAAMKPVLQHS